MVSLLAIPTILAVAKKDYFWVLYIVGLICILGVAWAVWRSKTESKELRDMENELSGEKSEAVAEAVGH